MKIAVVGLGYVGLPLAIQFARANVTVLGLDIDAAKVDSVNQGRSYIKHIASDAIEEVVNRDKLSASTDFKRVSEVEALIICVPTPLSRNREPDLSFVLDTGRTIAPHLSKGALVVLESTTYPGTTDGDLRSVLEEGSHMKAGVDFHLAFSPEREDPANEQSKVKVHTRFHPRFVLQYNAQLPFSRSRIGSRFQNDQGALCEMRRDRPAGLPDERQIGFAIFVQWRWHTNDDCFDLFDETKVC